MDHEHENSDGHRHRTRPRKILPPLDQETLQAIAVRYVERYQTSRAKLLRLLNQKLRMRGWAPDQPPPDPDAIADRMVELGYVNDELFAQSRARGLSRRGMGSGRVRTALAASGISKELQAEVLEEMDPVAIAIQFARRKRFGPFGPPPADAKAEARQMAAMARAGHGPALSRAIIRARDESELPESGGFY